MFFFTKGTLVHMGHRALAFPHQILAPVHFHHRGTLVRYYQKKSIGVPLQK